MTKTLEATLPGLYLPDQPVRHRQKMIDQIDMKSDRGLRYGCEEIVYEGVTTESKVIALNKN